MKNRYLIVALLLCNSCLFTLSSCDNDDSPPLKGPDAPTIEVVDSLVMVDLYNSMKGDKWMLHWDLKNPKTWQYVSFCTSENGLAAVEGLYLNELCSAEGGVLPETLGNLKYLKHLTIACTKGLDCPLPESLYDCKLLTQITLSKTNLRGPLSPKISQLENLKYLSIEFCPNFISEIPIEMADCKSLNRIYITYTGFKGKIPYELNNLPLGYITLTVNHFTDFDWRYFSDESKLVPDVRHNDFTGLIPEEIFQTEKWKKYGDRLYPFNYGYGFDNYDWKPSLNNP